MLQYSTNLFSSRANRRLYFHLFSFLRWSHGYIHAHSVIPGHNLTVAVSASASVLASQRCFEMMIRFRSDCHSDIYVYINYVKQYIIIIINISDVRWYSSTWGSREEEETQNLIARLRCSNERKKRADSG